MGLIMIFMKETVRYCINYLIKLICPASLLFERYMQLCYTFKGIYLSYYLAIKTLKNGLQVFILFTNGVMTHCNDF